MDHFKLYSTQNNIEFTVGMENQKQLSFLNVSFIKYFTKKLEFDIFTKDILAHEYFPDNSHHIQYGNYKLSISFTFKFHAQIWGVWERKKGIAVSNSYPENLIGNFYTTDKFYGDGKSYFNFSK